MLAQYVNMIIQPRTCTDVGSTWWTISILLMDICILLCKEALNVKVLFLIALKLTIYPAYFCEVYLIFANILHLTDVC